MAARRWRFGSLKASDSLTQLPLEPTGQIPHILADYNYAEGSGLGSMESYSGAV